jgi:hypothetical protein
MTYAKMQSAVPSHVLSIFLHCAPTKIIQAVVQLVSIKVPTLLPFLARSNERFQHQSMNCQQSLLSVSPEHHNIVARPFVDLEFPLLPFIPQ